jgi:hypothetical protein
MAKQQNHPTRTWLAFVLVLVCSPAMANPQDREPIPGKPSPFPNAFGRFTNSTSPPRDTKGFGSFFMPLKSFSNPFRFSNSVIEDDQEPARNFSDKAIREPFSTPSERRQRPETTPSPRGGRGMDQVESNSPSSSPVPESRPVSSKSTQPEPSNEVNSYAAQPKIESLDSVGTSRRTNSSTAVKKSIQASAPESDTKGESVSTPPPATEIPSPDLSPTIIPKKQNVAARSKPSVDQSSRNTSISNRPNQPEASNIAWQIQNPGFLLSMSGPDSILVGKAVPYELVAANQGQAPLQGLTIRLLVPSSVSIEDPTGTDGGIQPIADGQGGGIVWELKSLPANSKHALKLMVRTDQPEHFAMSLDWKIENPLVQIPVRVQQPQLILALEGASEADLGKPQVYRLRVRNPGNAMTQDVRIQLQANPAGSSEEILGDLPPGTEKVVEVELTFQQAGTNQIRATATSAAMNLEASRSIDVDVRQSQVFASWDGPDEFYQGSPADYTLTLENRGAIDALDNQCRIKLPVDVEIIELPPGISKSERQLQWDLPKIAVGEKLEFKFQFALNRSGDNPLIFEADSSNGESCQATVQTYVDAVADLALSVNDPISPAPVGKPVAYALTIVNRGKKAAEDVIVIAQFSEGIEPTQIEGHTGKLVPGQVLFDPIPRIESGQELSLTVTAQASKPGIHRFRASVRCQGSEDDLLKEESTRYASSGSKGTLPANR